MPTICSAGHLTRGSEEERLAALDSYGILDTPPDPAFDEIAEVASYICATPIAVINFVDRHRQWFKSVKGLSVRETPLDVSICAHAILQPGLFVVPDTTRDPRFADFPLVTGDPHLRFYAGALLENPDGHALGTLCVLDYRPRNLDNRQRFALQALANQVMTHLALMRSHREQARLIRDLEASSQQLSRQAATDPLTGLLNRRGMEQWASRELALIGLGAAPAALLVMDLDHFKRINDQHGHEVGDRALQRFADLCREVFREADAVGRWGGEEFLALMPATTLEQARSATDRLHRLLAQTPLFNADGKTITATVSIGLCALHPGSDIGERIHKADQLLYQAKQAGRSRTESE